MLQPRPLRVGIDTGGTFTDCVFLRAGRLQILKVFSTPRQPADAIEKALAEILAAEHVPGTLELSHGTTVGTNSLLERKGARIALVTTAGFEDVLVIGRQARPRLYDFFVTLPPLLVPASRRLGVVERIGAGGRVVQALTPVEVQRVVARVKRSRPQAVAVCLLFSFANPDYERRLTRSLRRAGLLVSAAHEIHPEFREYERTATVAANAYLVPVLGRYLEELDRRLARPTPKVRGSGRGLPTLSVVHPRQNTPIRVMQSSGGTISARVAAAQPVRTILSGPAGGVVGARYVAELAGYDRLISFDMGGTSTDVALIDGALQTTNEGSLAGLPLAVPMLDIHSVGAGGGSIAWFDRGGALRVGPQSAGADPGPICYGKGTEPTVTDAHLILGRLDPKQFLGGTWLLDAPRTRIWMEKAVAARAISSVEEFAAGILAVANATMEKAIRVISVERGYDPRRFTLVAFGGAGGLHACALAAALGIPRVLVPKFPGALSALGILRSDVVKDYVRTLLLPVADEVRLRKLLERHFAELERQAVAALHRRQRSLDLRYRGQAYELTLPYGKNFVAAFHRAHQRRYGYADPTRAVEVVNVRLRAVGLIQKPALERQPRAGESPQAAWYKRVRVIFPEGALTTDFYVRERLRAGNRLRGPAVIAEYSATTLVPPGWRAWMDAYENLLLEPRQ